MVYCGSPSKELIDRVVAAFNARNVDGMWNCCWGTLEVPGVGGERGKNMTWVRASFAHRSFRSERLRYQGEWIVVIWDEQGSERVLASVNRFEEEDHAAAARATLLRTFQPASTVDCLSTDNIAAHVCKPTAGVQLHGNHCFNAPRPSRAREPRAQA